MSLILSRLFSSFDCTSKENSTMEIELNLDNQTPVYTNHDQISGTLVLDANSSLRLSNISVTLLGTSTSRASSTSQVEQHQVYISSKVEHIRKDISDSSKLVRKTQKLFPPEKLPLFQNYADLTIGAGRHSFPFSIMVCVEIIPGPACPCANIGY